MKGLLYKDYCIFRTQIRMCLLVFGFMVLSTLFTGEAGAALGIVCAFIIINTFLPFTAERICGSDSYTFSLPVARKEIAAARYVYILLLDLTAALAGAAVILGLGCLVFGENIMEETVALAAVLEISLLLQSILLPTVYRLGEGKARFIMLILVVAAVFLVNGAVTSGKMRLTQRDVIVIIAAGVLLTVVAFALSYFLSAAILEKKDA